MKTCNKCKETKELTEFYACAKNDDGRATICMACSRATKEATKARREKEKSLSASDRLSGIRLVTALQTEIRGLKAELESRPAEVLIPTDSARRKVRKAIDAGLLVRPAYCSQCGHNAGRIYGHHRDYAFPLVVQWLCAPCHGQWHEQHGAGKNSI